MSRSRLLLLALLFEGGLGLTACGLRWAVGDPLGRGIRVDRHALLWGAWAALPMAGSLPLAARLSWRWIRRLTRQVTLLVREVFAGSGPLDWAVVSLLAGVGEECLFRGFLQDRLALLLGPAPAVLVASLFFGLAHPISPAYVLMAAVAGAYLGTLYLATGNLVIPMVTHALYDFVALAYLLRRMRGGRPA